MGRHEKGYKSQQTLQNKCEQYRDEIKERETKR